MPIFMPPSSLAADDLLALLAGLDQTLYWSGSNQEFNLAYLYNIGGINQINLIEGGSVHAVGSALALSSDQEIYLLPSYPGVIRMNYAALTDVNEININGELVGGGGTGIDIWGFHFGAPQGYPVLSLNGNPICNGDGPDGELLRGTAWNTGNFILGNDGTPGDGYIRGASLYVETGTLSFFGASPSAQQSGYGDIGVGASAAFWTDYADDAVALEDTAMAVNYCLQTLRAFGLIST